MAEGTVRSAAVPAIGSSGRWFALLALVVLLAAAGLLLGTAAILLVGCVAAGFGITYLSGIALNLEERLAFGTVLGAMAVSLASFVVSMLVRDVTLGTVITGLGIAVGAGAGVAIAKRDRVATDISDAIARWSAPVRTAGHPWPLAAVFLVCGTWTVHFFHQAYVIKPDGLWAGYVNIWGDWAAHLTFAGSFAYGHNFPPQYPIDPGNHLGYPFMIDFLAANLVPLGSSLPSALALTSGLLGLAFPAVLYLAAARFTGSRGAAALAVFVFLLGGGLGFVYLAGDIVHSGLGVLVHLPREYTLDRDLNFQWLNPVLAYLVPQRSTLFGFSLALIVLLLVWLAVRERHDSKAFLFAGIVAGLMPAFHVHAYGTVVALAAFWAAFNRRREWIAFFVPALALAIPVLVWMWPPANNSACGAGVSLYGYCLEPGWLSYTDWRRDGVLSFPGDFSRNGLRPCGCGSSSPISSSCSHGIGTTRSSSSSGRCSAASWLEASSRAWSGAGRGRQRLRLRCWSSFACQERWTSLGLRTRASAPTSSRTPRGCRSRTGSGRTPRQTRCSPWPMSTTVRFQLWLGDA